MLYLKQIEEDIRDILNNLEVSPTTYDIVNYFYKLCIANGVDIQYDKISYCTQCDIKPELIKREDHSGMAGSWVDYYKLVCPECHKSTKECDDWGKDYMAILIKEWNNLNK